MNLYLIYSVKDLGYDSYDSAVVVAKSAAAARKLHPDGGDLGHPATSREYSDTWVKPEEVEVEYLGKAAKGRKAGEVICASFNAG